MIDNLIIHGTTQMIDNLIQSESQYSEAVISGNSNQLHLAEGIKAAKRK
jgi:hypothetical protein